MTTSPRDDDAPVTTSTTSNPLAITIADSTLHVTGHGGTVGLGITETAPSAASSASITITGLPRYETITDKDTERFHGSSVTISKAEVNSGLTLTSNYWGHGHPVATLQVTANDTVGGVTSHSATKSITVIDPPPATSTSTTSKLALLNQYMASGFDNHSGSAPLMSNGAMAFGHDASFFAAPRHMRNL